MANEIATKLLQTPYLKGVVDMTMIDFSKNCFFEKKIDSYGNLFAFSNKVFDCRTEEVRDILSSDYIMNNTGYIYPEEIDEKAKTIIEDYYTTIYPDDDVCKYMWNNDSLLLNGERIFQTFNIHTGSGCNSKSTKIVILKKALGDYSIEVNAETFTKAPTSSRDLYKSTKNFYELYLAKGRRMVFFNEPESDADNKLQVALLKKIADGRKAVLDTRASNNKPTLSSVDSGIGRRVRIIKYPVKFFEKSDPENQYQAKLNNYSNKYIADSNIVLAFIMDSYEITGNNKDSIPSSEIFNVFKNYTKDKMTQSKFKDDMLGIDGTTCNRKKTVDRYRGCSPKSNFF
ncbi:hypothetical protein T492DRAFT_832926 [Pavlovales sp. CCMP2436]|nr:hypothetical protein T492DRAFT_832926 [Pavlovales sp. CCMP2436]